jgi:transcriptional regulator with XRE-family HTH domain
MIGERIRTIRTQKGLSQEYVAEHLHMSQSTLARIEQGKAQLDAARLTGLCDVLEVGVDDLLTAERVNINGNTFSGHSTLNGYVEQLVSGQKELYEGQVSLLKGEVASLRKQVSELLAVLSKK